MNTIPTARSAALAATATLVLLAPARADLVAHYAFDEPPGSGDTVSDSLGANHGTLINPADATRGIAAPNVILGTACQFGLRAGVNLGTADEVRPVDQFTITWWMRPDTLDAFDRIYETLDGTGNDGNGIRIDLGAAPGNRVRVLLRDGNGTTSTLHTHSLNLDTNGTWYFVALRYDSTLGDGSALKLTVLPHAPAVTAAQITGATESPASLGTGPLFLHDTGAFLAADDPNASGTNDFGGALDDFAIFQTGDSFGVLSDADLAGALNMGALAFDPPDAPPAINSFTTSETSIASGASITLSWDIEAATSISIEPDIGNVDARTTNGLGSTVVTPAATTVYTLSALNSRGSATVRTQVVVDGQLLPPRLTEFMADNNDGLRDGDGNTSDWIEIHNPNLVPLDLGGHFLTDDATELTRWRFPPDTVLAADARLVVFASDQPVDDYVDPDGALHLSFALNADGEFLALVAPDGTTLLTEFAPEFPAQKEDISYGPDGFYAIPTPGAPNQTDSVIDFVADTTFSVDRGFYDQPFDVAINTATPNAAIYYTTDGSEPSPANGTRYTAPLTVATTTVLRAAAFKDGYAPTNVDTQTYLFLDDVLRQPNSHPGYPAIWAGKPADYEMDPNIVNHPAYADDMIDALKRFPSLSIAINRDHMFGAQGLYQNPQSQGDAWERPVSAELIAPDGSEPGFQVDAGLRIQGGSSRNPDIPKHAFSLRFRREYGAGKLRYPLFAGAPFGRSAVEEFDYLQLRGGFNFSWHHRHYYQSRHAQYNRDQFVNDLFLAMGQPGSRGRWVHLYLNGLYWGMYHVHERPDADYMASYFGGSSDDYDALNSGRAVDGDTRAWDTMVSIANGNIASPSQYARIQRYLNVDSLIDYMLVNYYVGNTDWDGHNWRAARRRGSGSGYLFFPWDSEFAISPNGPGVINNPAPLSAALSTDMTGRNGNGRPTGLHHDLTRNAEYRLRFADRAHKHLFNDGVLTPDQATATWRRRSAVIDDTVVAESARWGDFRVDVDPGRWSSSDFDLYTRDFHYRRDQAWLLRTYLQRRTAVVVGQLRTRGWYPATAAPVFSQHGGQVPLGTALAMENPGGTGTIYYTLDGTDPRDPGAGGNLVAATAIPYSDPPMLTQSGPVRARVLNDNEWSALNEAVFLTGPLASPANLIVSEIMYNPAGPSEDTEFVELLNLSAADTIELGHARFVTGIGFTFPANTRLAPGERLLVVADPAAFEAAYGSGFPVAGPFTGNLDNDGEQLVLEDAFGEVILDFRYNDGDTWPAEADGDGRSLVLRAPTLGSDLNDPLTWRDSLDPGGNPNRSDGSTFTGDPGADNDNDGLSALLEYALGTSDTIPNPSDRTLVPALDSQGHLLVSVPLNLRASDLDAVLEHSSGLVDWSPAADFELNSLIRDAASGTAVAVYRSGQPAGESDRQRFLRWSVRLP